MTFDPNGLKNFVLCPHCKVNVAQDKINHALLLPDRIDCKVAKKIFKLEETTEIQITDNELMNQIARITKIMMQMSPQMSKFQSNVATVQNNFLNLHKRLQALEKTEMQKLKWIQGLSKDIINITQFLETLPEFKKMKANWEREEKEKIKDEVKQ